MAIIPELDSLFEGPADLSVLKSMVPGDIKPKFFKYGVEGQTRAGHRHHLSWNVLVCLKGKCRVYCNNGESEQYFS